MFWLSIARRASLVASEHFFERADDTFCIAKTYLTFDLILKTETLLFEVQKVKSLRLESVLNLTTSKRLASKQMEISRFICTRKRLISFVYR